MNKYKSGKTFSDDETSPGGDDVANNTETTNVFSPCSQLLGEVRKRFNLVSKEQIIDRK